MPPGDRVTRCSLRPSDKRIHGFSCRMTLAGSTSHSYYFYFPISYILIMLLLRTVPQTILCYALHRRVQLTLNISLNNLSPEPRLPWDLHLRNIRIIPRHETIEFRTLLPIWGYGQGGNLGHSNIMNSINPMDDFKIAIFQFFSRFRVFTAFFR